MKTPALKYLPPDHTGPVALVRCETAYGVVMQPGPDLTPTPYGNARMALCDGLLYLAARPDAYPMMNEVDKDRAAALAGVVFTIAPLSADNTTDPGGPSV